MPNYAIRLKDGEGVERVINYASMYEYDCCLASGRGIEQDAVATDRYFRMAPESMLFGFGNRPRD
jgi:hypothetical protein